MNKKDQTVLFISDDDIGGGPGCVELKKMLNKGYVITHTSGTRDYAIFVLEKTKYAESIK